MSRTHRTHLPPGKRAKRKKRPQPVVRSEFVPAMIQRGGAGPHGKTHKQTRGNEKAALRREIP